MIRKKQSLLLVAPYSTPIFMYVALVIKGKLLHLAASAIVSKHGLLGCDMHQFSLSPSAICVKAEKS
jgi:hypothetical protein